MSLAVAGLLLAMTQVPDELSVAILIGSSTAEPSISRNDVSLVAEGLRKRKVPESSIRQFTSTADLPGLITGIDSAVRPSVRLVFVFISAPGSVVPSRLTPQLHLASPSMHDWQPILNWVRRNPQAYFEIVADTGYTNLLYGMLPANCSMLVPDATWQDVTRRRMVGTVSHSGQTMQVGVLSYIVARELPFSSTMAELAYRVNKYRSSGSMAAIWSDLAGVRIMGPGLIPLPGRATPWPLTDVRPLG